MSIGLVGRKSGMTRVFTEAGNSVPVTVVEVQPNRITQPNPISHERFAVAGVTNQSIFLLSAKEA